MHDTSCECSVGGADLFTTPPTQTAVLKRTTIDIHPTGNTSDEGPIEFFVSAPDDDYTALLLHDLELKCKIKRVDGANLDGTDKVGLVNFPLHSMTSQIDAYLGGKLVTNSNNTYPYLSAIEKLLTYSKDTFESQFTAELCYMDTPGKMEDLELENLGLVARRNHSKLSRTFTLRGSLHIPILRQERHLLNKVSLKIVLIPNNKKFYLMCPAAKEDDYKLVIESAKIEMVRLKMNPTLMIEHNKLLQTRNAIYPIRRGEIKTFSIPAGSMQATKENLFTGKLPRRLVIAMVDSDAFSGSVVKNPFNFKPFGLTYLCAYIDGERYPTRALQPDFPGKNYMDAFQTIYDGTGMRNDNQSLIFDRDSYANGYTLFIIQLAPGEPDSAAYDLTQRGNVRIEMKFKGPLASTITTIVYAEYDDQLEIDRDRNIFVEK